MVKLILRLIVIFVFFSVTAYLLIAFAVLEINPLLWDKEARFSLCVIELVIFIISAFINFYFEINK